MRFAVFSSRKRRELLRDPLSLLFGLGLPVVLLLLITLVQNSMSESGVAIQIFQLDRFTPGIAMFSLSFISLFGGMLLAGDRSSAYLTRLFASPLTAPDFILGYSLPLLPMALLQIAVCFGAAMLLGLPFSPELLLPVLSLLPTALLFIGFGLLLGSILTDKQVGPISSILVQVAALSSGMWFDLELIGGGMKAVGYALPFAHSVALSQDVLAGNFSTAPVHLLWIMGYTAVVFTLAILLFRRQMRQ